MSDTDLPDWHEPAERLVDELRAINEALAKCELERSAVEEASHTLVILQEKAEELEGERQAAQDEVKALQKELTKSEKSSQRFER